MAITCFQCQHINPDTATECQECQAVIAIVCIECGSFNPLPSQYCGECGVELERPAPVRVTASVSAVATPAIEPPVPLPVLEAAAVPPPPTAVPPPNPPAAAVPPPNPPPAVPAPDRQPAASVPLPVPIPEPAASPTPQAQPAPPIAAAIDPFIPEKAMESPPPRPTAPAPAANTPPPRPSVPRTNPAPTAASSGTRLQLTQAAFVHLGSDERLELPADQYLIYVGKPNEEIPPDIDVSHLPGAEVVSRIHAAIHNRDGVFTLEDAGSSNGTFLNGELIKPGTRFRRELKPGDTISLGKGDKCSFRFELEE